MRAMDRWLGNAGMALVGDLGACFTGFVESAGGLATSEGEWVPTELATNPWGVVQGGAHTVVHDAAMSLAINASLEGADRSRASLEIKTETMRPARAGDRLRVLGRASRVAWQVAWATAEVTDADGQLVSRSTGTFLLHRGSEQA